MKRLASVLGWLNSVLGWLNSVLDRVGAEITTAVGTMWCAIIFALLALVSLPAALHTHDVVVIVGWAAQTFLQLVLLSIILVGQRLESARTELRDQETHDAVMRGQIEMTAILADVQMLVAEMHPVVTAGVE